MKTKEIIPHASLFVNDGYVYFRVMNPDGYETQGSEPFAVGNTRGHKSADDAIKTIVDMLEKRGITSVEINR